MARRTLHARHLPLPWAHHHCGAFHDRIAARYAERRIFPDPDRAGRVRHAALLPAADLGRHPQRGHLADVLPHARTAGPPPDVLQSIPLAGDAIHNWWVATLSQPHGLAHLFAGSGLGGFHSARDMMKILGASAVHRLVDFGLAFLCLFFFYKDGQSLKHQITAIGNHFFSEQRWARYAHKIPTAIRATVNGLVLVGLAEGVLIGLGYWLAGVPSPVLWAAATGILAIIPFGAPVAFLGAAALLVFNDSVPAAIAVTVWGTIVLFIADHFVRPGMIGNATKLPFLAVLFGILGGVETLGLVGLFIGPVVMVLFVTLWYEANLFDDGTPAA